MNDDKDDDSYVLESEDWFCGLGILSGTALAVAANWAPAAHYADTSGDGRFLIVAFTVLWAVSKIVRAISRH